MKKVIVVLCAVGFSMSMSACSALQEYAVKAKDGAEQLSTTVADAAVYDLCEMVRLRDYKRIFNSSEKRKAHAKMCAEEEVEVIE